MKMNAKKWMLAMLGLCLVLVLATACGKEKSNEEKAKEEIQKQLGKLQSQANDLLDSLQK